MRALSTRSPLRQLAAEVLPRDAYPGPLWLVVSRRGKGARTLVPAHQRFPCRLANPKSSVIDLLLCLFDVILSREPEQHDSASKSKPRRKCRDGWNEVTGDLPAPRRGLCVHVRSASVRSKAIRGPTGCSAALALTAAAIALAWPTCDESSPSLREARFGLVFWTRHAGLRFKTRHLRSSLCAALRSHCLREDRALTVFDR